MSVRRIWLVPTLFAGGLGLILLGFAVVAIWQSRPAPEAPTEGTGNRPASPAAIAPPRTLESLKYLSPQSQWIVAWQPAALIARAEREGQPWRNYLEASGWPAILLDELQEASWSLPDVQQIVAGFYWEREQLWPHGVVVWRWRTPPDDLSAWLSRWQAKPSAAASRRDGDRQPRYTGQIRGIPIVLEAADERTWLLAFTEDDLAGGIAPPGIGHFPPELQKLIEPISPASFAWMVASEQNWNQQAWFALLQQTPWGQRALQEWTRAGEPRAAVLSWSFEPDLTRTLRWLSGRPATWQEQLQAWPAPVKP